MYIMDIIKYYNDTTQSVSITNDLGQTLYESTPKGGLSFKRGVDLDQELENLIDRTYVAEQPFPLIKYINGKELDLREAIRLYPVV